MLAVKLDSTDRQHIKKATLNLRIACIWKSLFNLMHTYVLEIILR